MATQTEVTDCFDQTTSTFYQITRVPTINKWSKRFNPNHFCEMTDTPKRKTIMDQGDETSRERIVKLETRWESIDAKLDLILQRQDLLNGRVGKLEDFKEFSKGAFVVLGAIAMALLSYVVTHIRLGQ